MPCRNCRAALAAIALLSAAYARADEMDDIACDYFDICDTTYYPPQVTTVYVVTVNTAPPPGAAQALSPPPAPNAGQRDLMLQAASERTMASVLRMSKGQTAESLIDFTVAQRLAIRANSLGNGELKFTGTNSPVAEEFERASGMTEGELYAYLSSVRAEDAKGLDAAKAAYARLLAKFSAHAAASQRKQLDAIKREQLAAALKELGRKPLPKGPDKGIADAEPEPQPAPPAVAAAEKPAEEPLKASEERLMMLKGDARTPSSERGRRELEELWLFMNEGSPSGNQEARDVTLFERVKRRYQLLQRRALPSSMPGTAPKN